MTQRCGRKETQSTNSHEFGRPNWHRRFLPSLAVGRLLLNTLNTVLRTPQVNRGWLEIFFIITHSPSPLDGDQSAREIDYQLVTMSVPR